MRIHTTITFKTMMITVDFIRPFSLQFLAQRFGSEVYVFHTGVEDVHNYPYRHEISLIKDLFGHVPFYSGSMPIKEAIREATKDHLKYWSNHARIH